MLRPPVVVLVDAELEELRLNLGEADQGLPVVFTSFFPTNFAIHAGDMVSFRPQLTGEPHSVALGRLVDEAAAVAEARRDTPLHRLEELPQMRTLPWVLPRTLAPGGQPDRSAAEPCFLDASEQPPVSNGRGGAGPCPDRSQPDFDGIYSLYSSGWLEPGDVFRVQFSPDIAPGSYGFMCLVHRSEMTGTIEVVPSNEERPRAADVRREGDAQRARVLEQLATVARTSTELEGPRVFAGMSDPGVRGGAIAAFVPDRVAVQAGEPVIWRVDGTHAIAFGEPREAIGILDRSEGRVVLNELLLEPQPRTSTDARALTHLMQEAARLSIDGGLYNGREFRSSGIMRSSPPATTEYTLVFEEPGAYAYGCLVHREMVGRVEVG